MVCVGVHELRNRLSLYLRLARKGQTVLITRRKRIVAVLQKPDQEPAAPVKGRK